MHKSATAMLKGARLAGQVSQPMMIFPRLGKPCVSRSGQQLASFAPQVRSRATATSATAPTATPSKQADTEEAVSTVTTKGRIPYTLEIMVSKLLPGGFGWQASSIMADNAGYAANTWEFAAITGCGDMTGVFVGHSLYKAGQSLVSKDVSVADEIGTAAWLGSAAFFAGGVWQPIVNLLHDDMGLAFTPTAIGCFATCGAFFFGGLRLGRAVMPWMASGTPKNLAQDAGLSVSIGGATGMFVATDPTFVGVQADMLYQYAAPVFNITNATPELVGCVMAGSSTLTGFGMANLLQSVTLPAGMNWMDGNNPYSK